MNVTNITIRWNRVDCQERNGHTDSYRIVSYPTLSSDSYDRIARTLVGIEDNDRMFSITGLPPRTSYTFEVQASNPTIDARGPPVFYTASTTAPQGIKDYGNNYVSNIHCFFCRPWLSSKGSALSEQQCCDCN